MAKKDETGTEEEETEEVDETEETEEEDDDESGSTDEDESGDDEEQAKLVAENNRLKREAAERSKRDREAARKRKEEEGKYKDIADDEKKRADELEERIQKMERERIVEKVAKNVGLEFPEDAPKYLSEDDMADERLAERALRKLKKDRPKLFVDQRRSGADIDDDEEDDDERGTQRGSGEAFGLDRLRRVKRKNT